MSDTFFLDALAVGAHPDDVEISCGGTIALLTSKGYKVGILDLTGGEAGTRGTRETREQEAKSAAEILGLFTRVNLNFPDGDVGDRGASSTPTPRSQQLISVVNTLRTLRPEILFLSYEIERHPDHEAATQLLREAIFLANLERWNHHLPDSELSKQRYRPRQILFYEMRYQFEPSFICDVTPFLETKYRAIEAFATQVTAVPGAPETLVGSSLSLHSLKARDSFYGAKIGVAAGEAFLSHSVLPVRDPISFFREQGVGNPLYFKV